jgi:hypothetical protein
MTWYPYFISTFIALDNCVSMDEVEFVKRINIFLSAVYSYGIEDLRSSEKKLRLALEYLFKDVHPTNIYSNFEMNSELTFDKFYQRCRLNAQAPPKNWVLLGSFADEKTYYEPMILGSYGGFMEVHPSQTEFSMFIRGCMAKQIYFTEYNDETPADRELRVGVDKIAPLAHKRTRSAHFKRLKKEYADLGRDCESLLYDAVFQHRELSESEYMKYPELTNLLVHYSLTYCTPEAIDYICKLYPEHEDMMRQKFVSDEEFEKICEEFPTKAVELHFVREHSPPDYDFSNLICSDAEYRLLDGELYKFYFGKEALKALNELCSKTA